MLDGKNMTKKKNKKAQAPTRQIHENNQVEKMISNGGGAAIADGEDLIYISPSRVRIWNNIVQNPVLKSANIMFYYRTEI